MATPLDAVCGDDLGAAYRRLNAAYQQALRYAPRNEGHGGSLACQAHGNFTADAAVAGAGDDSHFAGEARRLWYVFYGFGG